MITSIFTAENLLALLTLTLMEIVLGIDNVIFIAILVGKIPEENRVKARVTGIMLALVLRIILLFSLTWIMRLTEPLFTLFNEGFTGRDLILIAGGLFLVAKSTIEIREKVKDPLDHATEHATVKALQSLPRAIIQIMIVDLIFSIDSVVTAVGMAQHLGVMILAVIISMCIMLWLSGPISNFIDRNPTLKMLALSFLILIGVSLVVEGTGGHIAKGYIYFAMAFSLVVEMINLRIRKPEGK